jgi:hypothetical protein
MRMKFLIAGGASWLLPLMLFPQISYLPGWPQTVQAPTGRPIYIADIDDDGALELVTMTIGNNFQNDMLYAFENDGTVMPGFPIAAGNFFSGNPALFDSDDDGRLEIAVAQNGHLYLMNQQGNALWTVPYAGPIFQSQYYPFYVSVDDLDNDGNKEIILTCYDGGAVFVFDAHGNVRPGWPVIIPPGCGTCSAPSIQVPASIADIDQDGVKEIVVPLAGYHLIYAFKPDGSYCPGFPVDTINVNKGQATLADIDEDGYFELIFVNSSHFFILRYDGTNYQGFPIFGYTALSEPSIAYSNGEYFIGFTAGTILYYENYLYRLNPIQVLPGWPVTVTGWHFTTTPLWADVYGNSDMDILSGAYSNAFVSDGRLYAFGMDGSIIAGFPTANLFHRGITKTGAVNDVNGDGNLDYCYGSQNNEFSTPTSSTIYCWDTGYPYNLDNVDWAMDGFDLGHTGRWRRLYHISKINSQLAVAGCSPANPCYLPPDGSQIAVDVTAIREHGGANPPGQDVRYSRTLGCGNYEGPVIDHGDGTYTRMLRAPTADCTTDIHAWVNEFKLQDYQQIVFTSGCVIPPPAFSLLNPLDGAIQQPLNIALEWPPVGTLPNQAVSYDLYFGTTPDPPGYQIGLTTTYFELHNLAPATTYYWRVDARNACGVTSSPVWTFTTACQVPGPFANLCPADGSTNLPLDMELSWQSSAQAESYRVSLGLAPDALSPTATTTTPSHSLQGLSAHTTYYWQVRAQNACGETPGPVWSFTTGEGECRHCRPVSPP